MKFTVLLAAISAASLLAACGEKIEVTTNSPNLKVSVSSCKESRTPGAQPSIQKIRWTESMTVEITARGDMSCGVDRVTAGYAVSGTTVELGYAGSVMSSTAKPPPPGCRCVHEFTYVISDIDKRGYVVVLDDIARNGTLKKWQSRRLKLKFRDQEPPAAPG
jgi:hypothetical protein